MSKTINVQDTYTSNTVSFDSTNSEYASVVSGYPIENGIGDGSGTYAGFVLKTGSSAVTNVYYNFDCSGIPSGATITSVACRARASRSSTSSSYIASAYLQLCTGTTTKGSQTSVATTTATYFNLTPGTWTLAELQNAKIRFRGTRGTRSTSSTSYSLRFFGAVLTVEYSFQGTAYTVTATSSVTGITTDPVTQDVIAGNDCEIIINANSIDDLEITDNGNDISSLLVRHHVDTGGTVTQAPASYTTSGSISGTHYQGAIGHTVESPGTQTGNDYCSSSGSTATIYYKFDFSELPENATISSMSVQAYGHLENASQSNEVARLNTYYGTTAKGTQVSFTSTSNQTVTITPGTWTAAELRSDARVGFTIGYYGGLVTGITWSVIYTVPSSGNDYYYVYSINDIAADHTILIEEAGAFVPPEEDPTYNYYPITISSINATTNPSNGTTRVQEGTNQTITITPTDPQLTLALDNGVDITSQLVGGTPTNTYTITTQVSGASYGFNLNSSTGYYVSTNNGHAKSASVARLNMDFESDCLVTIQYINYAEASYDYGMFGKLDTSVATDGLTANSSAGQSTPSDSTSNYQIPMCSNSASAQTVSYQVPAGEHYIDIKYGKDDASDSNNDSLQWKVLSVEATSAGGDYTYTLTNVTQKHSLIFIFGDVDYYFITSSGNASKLFPDGQVVKLEGDSYRLVIVPNNPDATVSLVDNNVNRTSQLEFEEGEDKYGNRVVNYTYSLSNITAAHTINVTCSSGTGAKIYIKNNGSWVQYSKVFLKVNGSWVEQSSTTWSTLLDPSENYRIVT